jgi:drug/metabolite transporter (DMT)-like permease
VSKIILVPARRHASMVHLDPRHSVKLVICLATVYVVWGSSFMFSKIAVNHLPIAMLSGARFVTAGTALALFAHYWGGATWPGNRRDWGHTVVLGFLMVFASNGLNIWAIQYIPTNESALLNGTAAFWIAGFGVFGRRGHPLTRRAIIGLAVGFIGTALMLIPQRAFGGASLLAQLGALGGCFAWSVGTVYYRSLDSRVSPLMLTALQMWFGGLMMLTVGFAHGDWARWSANTPGLVALAYLTLCSSCLAYTAYGWLTRHTTPTLIGTYSYVNPAIAAFLGWEFLDERLSGTQLTGMVIIIAGVVLLTLPGGPLLDPQALEEPKSQ